MMAEYYENKKKEMFVGICEYKKCKAKKEKIIFSGEYNHCPYCGHELIAKRLSDAWGR